MAEEKCIGYLKYKGKRVEGGLLDARKAAQALLGFDEAVRFFVGQQSSGLRDIEFEIPVRIREGSWEASIPPELIGFLKTAIGAGIAIYGAAAVKKVAENDFSDARLKDIFTHAIEAIQWMIRIGKHLGEVTIKRFENVRFRNENTEIGIQNVEGVYLYIPKKYFKFFESANPKLLKNMTGLIEEERELEVGLYKDGKLIQEEVSCQERYIFAFDDKDIDEVLFPELEHGKSVELEGHITRGNENSNSLGFKYKDHILTCYPDSGSVTKFKSLLFLDCRVKGRISRLDKFGGYDEAKPKIVFSHIEPLEPEKDDPTLF